MDSKCISNCRLEETGFNYTMSLIQGKYKMFILYTLMEFGVVRFNEMQKYIGTITFKTLSSTLKQLPRPGSLSRSTVPPCICAIFFTIGSPSPVPWTVREASAR